LRNEEFGSARRIVRVFRSSEDCKVSAAGPASDNEASFTLDAGELAERRAAASRRVHTVQLPAVRAAGFAILCAIAILQDVRLGVASDRPPLALLLALNAGYAVCSWAVLRAWYGRTGRLDLGLLFMHLDILVWLPNLYHLEQAHLFFACLLLVRVADQVGWGFRQALWFNHVVVAAYLAYSGWIWYVRPGEAFWTTRLTIAATMYLLGIYLAFSGLVSERLRRRMREAMRTARELVESLGQKQRALEIQARDLEEARRRAEQANVAKAQFLATISHEIRTPMNGVLGATELLAGTPLDDEQRHLVETASRSAAALLVLIDDVLDLSRIEASKLTLQETTFDLRSLVQDAVDLMATTVRDKPLTLSCTIARRLPGRVVGDPMRLRQVLVNLLHNAVKFTDRGHVVLEVSLLQAFDDAVRLRFAVRDTGIGIAEDQFDSVFDAFTQVDSSSTRRHGGSGLGLAIVKQLADLMGGSVGVDSRVDQGSTFWLELAMKIGADAAPAPAPPPEAAPVPPARILLAEDDPVNQMVVSAMLEKLGCAVDIVEDGEAACRAVAEGRYDLVFMDCHMPVMDGFEATRRIRERAGGGSPRLSIVALTADALAGDRERCLDSGMDDYMTKPVSAAQLGAAVRRWAGGSA
jgi:signal transduction histidine kinase/ActR/RegA family two-component response regulator